MLFKNKKIQNLANKLIDIYGEKMVKDMSLGKNLVKVEGIPLALMQFRTFLDYDADGKKEKAAIAYKNASEMVTDILKRKKKYAKQKNVKEEFINKVKFYLLNEKKKCKKKKKKIA